MTNNPVTVYIPPNNKTVFGMELFLAQCNKNQTNILFHVVELDILQFNEFSQKARYGNK